MWGGLLGIPWVLGDVSLYLTGTADLAVSFLPHPFLPLYPVAKPLPPILTLKLTLSSIELVPL